MTAISFTVNRARPEDGEPQEVKCIVPMCATLANKLDGCSDEYNEREYDRFCDNVWRYVRDQHNLETGLDWYFSNGISVIEIDI